MYDPLDNLTRQFLDWLAAGPRPYDETMAAWRTSCPRLTVWEDAQSAGLVERSDGANGPMVRLTELGRARLAATGAAPGDA